MNSYRGTYAVEDRMVVNLMNTQEEGRRKREKKYFIKCVSFLCLTISVFILSFLKHLSFPTRLYLEICMGIYLR